METFNCDDGNNDGSSKKNEHFLDIFSETVRPSKGAYHAIPKKDFVMSRRYLLNKCEEAEHFIKEHKEEMIKQGVGNIIQFYTKGKSIQVVKLYLLAMEPDLRGWKCLGCIFNGVRYHIQSHDELCKYQNSGTVVEGYHEMRFWYKDDYFVLATHLKQMQAFTLQLPRQSEALHLKTTHYNEEFHLSSKQRQVSVMSSITSYVKDSVSEFNST
ncbi:hypothetical protein RDI58_007188 [Solanum bulbocastanum]|uniref:Uncharacterized protein n=1 Tax=Solanum bulbocastanum TaxID=147425 RepID=A0AAN8YID1_SOLBU